MRLLATALLGALVAVLAGVLAAELAAGGPAGAALPRAPRPIPIATTASAGNGQVDRWVGTILARPLFSPSRRPAATAAAPDRGGLPRLAGVIVGPQGKTVIFAPRSGAAPILAHEGGRVGAYRVQSIGDGEVTVRGLGGLRVLRPVFASTPLASLPSGKSPQ